VTLRTRLGALHERDFRLLFFGHTISLLGDGMAPIALAFAVLDLTGSAADLGYVLAAKTVPLVGFLLVGGVFADRLPRRAVMIGADLTRFASQGLVAGLLISGHARVWELIVLHGGYGAASAFFNAAARLLAAIIPIVVRRNGIRQKYVRPSQRCTGVPGSRSSWNRVRISSSETVENP